MKKVIFFTTSVVCFLFIIDSIYSQITIITDDPGYTAGENTAVLDIKSTSKGLLIPRLTQSDREGIQAPANGLMIYQTGGASGFYYYNGNSWKLIGETVAESDPVFTAWDKSTGISITESQISDLGTYLETESDPSVPTGTQTGQTQYWNGAAWVANSTLHNTGTFIGINTTAPNKPLSIKGSGANSEWLQFKHSDNTDKWHINYQSEVLNFVETGVAANRFVLAPGGNIGIGTAIPGAKLEVNGQIKITGGSPGAGKVLTSDANGTATWQPSVAPAAGAILHWNGSAWVSVAPGSTGNVLTLINGVPTWQKPAIPSMGPTDVYNHSTGKVWMDRNLGASQVATSGTDAASYGFLYQWGRLTDGHQIRGSGFTTTLSNSDVPGHGNFIKVTTSPLDWRSPQNNNLWQGVNGTNNPCPDGYRLPTSAEWVTERDSWSSNNAAGAFASPLKLPMGGFRPCLDDPLVETGTSGVYWSSTLSDVDAVFLYFRNDDAGWDTFPRASGMSVRCLKD